MNAVKGPLHLKMNDYYANFYHLCIETPLDTLRVITGVRNIIKFKGI